MNDPHRKGRLVVLEGIDGAGKSTVLQRLVEFCQSEQIPHVVSREPTTGPWGRKLRESALSGRLSLTEELELFLRDRAEHVRELIAPALAEGKVVLLDRYYFSTAAYQGARGADPEHILCENEKFAPIPDLVLLLDLDPLAGRARITGRGDTPDQFEGAEALAQVRAIFLQLRRPCIQILDASQPAQEVTARALEHFAPLLRSLTPST